MGLIISKTDFTGKHAIATNNFDDLTAYITRYEKKYLRELLGVTLFDLFEADLANPTQNAIYAAIQDEFDQDFNSCVVSSKGMKEMLLGFIFFEYMKEKKFKNTNVGIVVGTGENSREVAGDTTYIYSRYNEAIETYDTIQWYISEHEEDYPDYNGQMKAMSHWSL